MSLADVYDAYRAERAFDSVRSPGNVLIPGEGSSRPKILVVGEAPGATESTTRRPFTGASGRVLRSFLKDVCDLPPETYFMTNVIKYRLPGRSPHLREVKASVPYLRREYAALGSPPVLVAVGNVAWAALRPESYRLASIIGLAGTPVELPGGIALWPMIQPNLGLQHPELRGRLEKDWERFGAWFREEFP